MLSEEDRGPAWMRDYGYTDFSQIEADVTAMEQFATQLQGDVTKNYNTHVPVVQQLMLTELPSPPAEFQELSSFLVVHNDAQNISQQNVFHFSKGTEQFATVAKDVSKDYRGSDAFSHAKVSDVDSAFTSVSKDGNE
ncbi:hypothetical protein ACIA5C_27695 [Actinoplanes sp. NPDC051343]|jgi:hypothetical protein|uniref:hypothetical protein n=1 Tax=Actinoplanes sp. NPDC051343 TaxID=3363906 RepID=UPI0037990357